MELSRRKFLKAAAAAAMLAGCGDFGTLFNPKKQRNITLTIDPAEPLFNNSAYFSGEHWDTAEVSLASIVQGTASRNSWFYLGTPGQYIITAHGVYGDNETGDASLVQSLFVRHTNKVAAIRNTLPAGTALTNAEWNDYLLPYLSTETKRQISEFEGDSTATLGTINSRLVNDQGLWYGITLTNPASLAGMGPAYAANLALSPLAQTEIVEQGHSPQSVEQSMNTVLQVQPTGQMSGSPQPDGTLPLPEGNITAHYVFDWINNYLQKTMGVICGSNPSDDPMKIPRPWDKSVIAQYQSNVAGNPAYRNPSLLVIQEGMKAWEIRKAMKTAINVHNSN